MRKGQIKMQKKTNQNGKNDKLKWKKGQTKMKKDQT